MTLISVYFSIPDSLIQFSRFFADLFRPDTWHQLSACDVLLVRHDHDCGYIFHGLAYAQIIDSFGDLCEKRDLTVRSVATLGSGLIGEKAYRSPVTFSRSDSIIGISGMIVRLLRGRNFRIQWEKQQRITLWCRILEKARPKYVIGILPDEYLCTAAKLKKIPVYDLQHGVISGGDHYYGETYRRETPQQKLPDAFLLWDSQSADLVTRWALGKCIPVRIIGNPWFIRFLRAQADDLLVAEASADNYGTGDPRPCILVSLQWGIASGLPEQVCNGILAPELEQVIRDTIEQYNWIIRLHPVQLSDTAEREATIKYLSDTFGTKMALQWVKTSKIPLPVILSTSDLHITCMSSIVAEASWMGIRSGLPQQEITARRTI